MERDVPIDVYFRRSALLVVLLAAVRVRMVIVLLLSVAAAAQSQTPRTALPSIRDCAAISLRDASLRHLSAVCESVKAMRRTLPNFVCEQTTQRHRAVSMRRGGERTSGDAVADVVTATVTFEDWKNRYDDIKIDGVPVDTDMFDLDGLSSMGEFASDLLSIFFAENAAAFRFRQKTKTLEGDALVFDFYVAAATNRSWMLREKNRSTHPGLQGALWLDASTNQVLRFDLEVSDIDIQFATDRASRTTIYDDVHFQDGGDFLLPVRSEASVCTRDQYCTRNTTEWKNCKRFTGKARIVEKIE